MCGVKTSLLLVCILLSLSAMLSATQPITQDIESTSNSADSLPTQRYIYPDKLFQKYRLFQPFEISDSTKVQSIRTSWENTLRERGTLNITGSKTMSVSVSNTEMVDVNQSLFLRIDGKISDNVFIQAQLNDNQSPITPQGDSREISSLDEIFFRVYGRQYDVSFGDLRFDITDTQFINFSPVFEGLKISYFDKNKAAAAIAISNSRSAFVNITAIEGKQGPYFLRPDGARQNVKILSGTETIYLNGQRLQRGDDFRIDYNEGSIEFSNKHFISENTRIQASFQYSDEEYRKNAIYISTELNITDRLQISAAAIYQNDDRERPIAQAHSSEDIQILQDAGDSTPIVGGVSSTEPGKGSYREEYIDGKEIYIYAPNTIGADYEVKFIWVGSQNGEYNQITPLRWDYVGAGNGDWNIGREIRAPQKWANYDIALKYTYQYFDIYTESLFTEHDKNTYSTIDDKDNFSQIHQIAINIYPDWDNFKPKLNTRWTYKQKNLYSFAQIENPQETYQMQNFTPVDSLDTTEMYINFKTISWNFITQETTYKITEHEDKIKRQALILNQNIAQKKLLPQIQYIYTYGNTEEYRQNTTFAIHEPEIQYTFQNLTLRTNTRFYKQTREEDGQKTQEEKQNTYFSEIAIDKVYNSGMAVSYQNETNYSVPQQTRTIATKTRTAQTWTLNTYSRIQNQYITALYSHRNIQNHTQDMQNQTFDIAEVRTINRIFKDAILLNSAYTIKNTEFYLRGRELVYVGAGIGLYDSTGVFSEVGEYDWETTVISEPQKSIELNANLNGYTYPANFVKKDTKLFNLLDKVNLETNISIAEQTESNDRWKLYLLHPTALANRHSIYSRQELRQSIWLNIQKNKSLARYTYRTDKTQDRRYISFYSTNDTNAPANNTQINEHEAALSLLNRANSDIELIYGQKREQDSRYDTNSFIKNHAINIKTAYTNTLTLSTAIGYEKENITAYQETQDIDRYSIAEDILYFIGNKYRLNLNTTIKYNDIKTPITKYLPHEKQKGMILNWKSALNYRINPISTIDIEIAGNKYPSQNAFYQIKMEAKVEF